MIYRHRGTDKRSPAPIAGAGYLMSYAAAVFHFPLVKSGNSSGMLPPATDFSEGGLFDPVRLERLDSRDALEHHLLHSRPHVGFA